jgi:cytochrome c553
MGSRMRGGVLIAIVWTLASPVMAQEEAQPSADTSAEAAAAPPAEAPPAAPAAAGDPVRGKAISYTCLGCHGIPNYKNAFPNYSVPKLEGQHAEYMVTALQAYRAGERSHLTMHSQASSLTDQDMRDIAAFFSGEVLKPGAKAVGTAPESAALCVACHGQDGVGITGIYPTLSGQHADYLERSLHDYKRGGRKNAIMAPMVAGLKDADIVALARYFSQQRPALKTEERPSTRLTAGGH